MGLSSTATGQGGEYAASSECMFGAGCRPQPCDGASTDHVPPGSTALLRCSSALTDAGYGNEAIAKPA